LGNAGGIGLRFVELIVPVGAFVGPAMVGLPLGLKLVLI
jgi:hypothetical protein